MAFAKFQENRSIIDGEIAENHAILVNLTATLVVFISRLQNSHWERNVCSNIKIYKCLGL